MESPRLLVDGSICRPVHYVAVPFQFQTAHATYLVKVTTSRPLVNPVDLKALERSLFGLFETLRRQEAIVS